MQRLFIIQEGYRYAIALLGGAGTRIRLVKPISLAGPSTQNPETQNPETPQAGCGRLPLIVIRLFPRFIAVL